jgi:hypothetical protein
MSCCVVHRLLSVKLYGGTTQKKMILTCGRDLQVFGTWVTVKAGKRRSTVHTPPDIFCPFQSINVTLLMFLVTE